MRWLASAAVVTIVTAPAAADDLDALLARPMSPGTLALLIPHAKDPRVEGRWRAGLADAAPEVRSTAARLLFVNGIASAAPDLVKVLATDTDSTVAVEAAHALLVMGQGAVDEAVVAAALRLESPDLALALADARGPDAIGHLGRLRALTFSEADQVRFLSALTRRADLNLDRITEVALAAADADLWRGVLDLAHRENLGIPLTRVTSALRSPSSATRAFAWWHIAVLAATDGLQKDHGLDLARDPALVDLPPNLAFGREVAERAMTRTKPGRPASLTPRQYRDRLDIPGFAAMRLGGALYPRLHPAERETLGVVKHGSVDYSKRRTAPLAPDYPILRSVAGLPPGYVADVLAQTGCRPSPPVELAAAVVGYSARRHLQELHWTRATLTPPCAQAARAILAAALLPAPAFTGPGKPHWVVLPMSQEFLQCLAGPSREPKAKVEAVGQKGIVPPRKLRDVRPGFPAAALKQRREALVVLQAGISPAGCVDRASVLQGGGTDFDLEALRAVTGWAFTPTLLNGQPVPVEMTITVDFSVR